MTVGQAQSTKTRHIEGYPIPAEIHPLYPSFIPSTISIFKCYRYLLLPALPQFYAMYVSHYNAPSCSISTFKLQWCPLPKRSPVTGHRSTDQVGLRRESRDETLKRSVACRRLMNQIVNIKWRRPIPNSACTYEKNGRAEGCAL